MKYPILIALAATLAASAAHAQVSTMCNRVGQQIYCNSTTPYQAPVYTPPMAGGVQGFNLGAVLQQAQAIRMAQQQQEMIRQQQEMLAQQRAQLQALQAAQEGR